MHGLDVDHLVCTHAGARCLVVKVAALPLHVLLLLGEYLHRLATAFPRLLPAGDSLLRLLQLLLCLAVVAGMLNRRPVGRNEEDLQTDVDAGLAAGLAAGNASGNASAKR